MNLITHRNAETIGGGCVEIATAATRIVIDFGMPLALANKEPFDSKTLANKSIEELKSSGVLPCIQGLYKNEEKGIAAVLLSHSYIGGYGLLNYIHPDIPIYMSQGVSDFINISRIIAANRAEGLNCAVIKPKRAFAIGDFTIGSYPVDNAAFDAYAFLISAHGKKIFYSGDFRGHTKKSSLSNLMRNKPPADIDCLVMDNSMRGAEQERYIDEESIEKRIVEILCSAHNITFLFADSQNIGRVISAYRACLRTNKIFIIDLYTAYTLDKLRKVAKSIPEFNWRNVRVKFDADQAETMNKCGLDKLLYFYSTKKIDAFDLGRKKNQTLMLIANNIKFSRVVKDLESVEGAKVIYSMPSGLGDEFKHYCVEKQINIELVDTDGYPAGEDVSDFANNLNAKIVIPIHSADITQHLDLIKNIRASNDNEIFEL